MEKMLLDMLIEHIETDSGRILDPDFEVRRDFYEGHRAALEMVKTWLETEAREKRWQERRSSGRLPCLTEKRKRTLFFGAGQELPPKGEER